jgi:hypothetical protein
MYFQGDAPSFGKDVFDWLETLPGWPPQPPLVIFDPVTIYYLPGTTGWSGFVGIIGLTPVLWTPQVQTGNASFGVRTNQFGFNIDWATGMTSWSMPPRIWPIPPGFRWPRTRLAAARPISAILSGRIIPSASTASARRKAWCA